MVSAAQTALAAVLDRLQGYPAKVAVPRIGEALAF
jgi:hypothetical protein